MAGDHAQGVHFAAVAVHQLAVLDLDFIQGAGAGIQQAIAVGGGGGIGLRCRDLFGGQLMLTGLQTDIGIQLCRDDVLRQTASPLMTYHTVIQMRQRMRVSSSFSEQKRCGERFLLQLFPFHSL